MTGIVRSSAMTRETEFVYCTIGHFPSEDLDACS